MIKPTPNPPETDIQSESDPTSPYSTTDSKKLHEAAERALDHYLNPLLPRKPLLKPNTRYLIAPGIDSEELLADACETLTSAKIGFVRQTPPRSRQQQIPRTHRQQ